jgi:hypothetical protein
VDCLPPKKNKESYAMRKRMAYPHPQEAMPCPENIAMDRFIT